MKRDLIAERPKTFSKGLHELLGVGVSIINNTMVKRLYEEAGENYKEKKYFRFKDYIKDVWEKMKDQSRGRSIAHALLHNYSNCFSYSVK